MQMKSQHKIRKDLVRKAIILVVLGFLIISGTEIQL